MSARFSTQVRKFPWPYKAAVSISNDCDFLTLSAMLALHRLFASSKQEGGLELEFSDSFFFYANQSQYPCFSYFDGLTKKPGHAAPALRELVSRGYLDTTHGLGDFEGGGFRRLYAEWALAEMEKHGLRLPVWSNHGGFGNIQNIARPECFYHQAGDDFQSPYYLMDLLYSMGVRYFWTDAAKAKQIVLQPQGPIATAAQRRPKRVRYFWPRRTIRSGYQPEFNYDRADVFETVKLRDGCTVQGFIRYDGFLPGGDSGLEQSELYTIDGRRAGPNIGRIAVSLSPDKLRKLVEIGGCAFLYQHFSTLAHMPKRTHITSALEFHPENLRALRRLKKFEEEGLIWVAAQAILLDYIYLLNTVAIDTRLHQSHARIKVTTKRDFEYRGCGGLTVEVGSHVRSAEFVCPDGKIVKAAIVGPDEKGCHWAAAPLRRLPPIDWVRLAREGGVRLANEIRVTELDEAHAVNLHLPPPAAAPVAPRDLADF